jgi:hypothetical protein
MSCAPSAAFPMQEGAFAHKVVLLFSNSAWRVLKQLRPDAIRGRGSKLPRHKAPSTFGLKITLIFASGLEGRV